MQQTPFGIAPGNLLSDITECPACGSADSDHAGTANPKGGYSGGLSRIGVPVDRVTIRKCGSCGSFWRQPWASPGALGALYRDAVPHHSAGLRYSQMAGILPGGGSAVDRFLRRHVKSFQSYGEFGCPIWGLLKYYSQPRFSVFGGLLDVAADAIIWNVAIGDLGDGLSRRLRLIRSALLLHRIPAPAHLAHIAPDHNFFWGARCGDNGVKCETMLCADTRGNPVKMLSMSEAPDKALNVLGMYDVLDHYPAPVELMRRLTGFAEHLFVYTHAPRHGWNAIQHAINFTPTGLEMAGQRAGWVRVADYRVRDEHTDYAILFRRV